MKKKETKVWDIIYQSRKKAKPSSSSKGKQANIHHIQTRLIEIKHAFKKELLICHPRPNSVAIYHPIHPVP
jgi:hypothetical protein